MCVAPVHPKAMPVILTSVLTRLKRGWQRPEALKLQRPLPDGMLGIVARGERKDTAHIMERCRRDDFTTLFYA